MSDELDKIRRSAGSYQQWALEQRKRYIDLRLSQDPELRALYNSAADRIADELRNVNSDTLTERHLEELEGVLRHENQTLGEALDSHITNQIGTAVQIGAYLNENAVVQGLKEAGINVTPFRTAVTRTNDAAVQTIVGRTQNGMQLSDRIWRTSGNAQDNIRRIIREAVATGESPLDTADLLQQYIRQGKATTADQYPELMGRVNPPKDLAYEALRLARTETTAAYGEGTIASANISPSNIGIQWVLSPSHPVYDVCDRLAAHDEGLGSGVYTPDSIPNYPPHPSCLCTLVPVHEEPEDFAGRLKRWLNDPQSEPQIERWYQNDYQAA